MKNKIIAILALASFVLADSTNINKGVSDGL